ncbi:MAG: ABC transporter permease [Fusobacteriaceae bacterium]|jgi:ribose transport system permease protein|nr:ABC transporter permease [Fusobacteriaceae bacterium]
MKNSRKEALAALTVGQQFIQKVKDDAKKDKIRRYAPLILLVIMTVIGALSQKDFFTWGNVVNIMYQMSIPLVISVGLSYVLLLGSIDLSIEGVMGFAGSFVAYLVINNTNNNHFGVSGIAIVVSISVVIGVITGMIHVKARIASFIVTYAIGSIMTGAAVLVYQGSPIQVKDQLFVALSLGKLFGIPYITIIAFVIFALGAVILNYTAFGRAVYAIGDNESAAASTGINIGLTKIKVFALSGCTAGLAGVLQCVRLKLGQASLGTNQMFPVVTAIVIGGGSLSGGKGGSLSAFVGVLIYTELANWLTLMGVDPYVKKVIQGVIIIIAVALTINRNRKAVAK